MARAMFAQWQDVVLVDGVRTPFVDYGGALGQISPIDMGIKVGKEIIKRTGIDPSIIGTVICGSMAQASYDAYMLPRHIGLFSGAPLETPAHLVQRVCGTGVEILAQAADAISLGRADAALCVGAESMSRNPVAAYTHRNGFRMGQVEFKDFLWEALYDPAGRVNMGDTAENLAKRHGITREEVDAYAARSFARAVAAQNRGFHAGEIVAVVDETFEREGLQSRSIKLKKGDVVSVDTHVRPSPVEALAKIRPAFGGVQTGGNSSAVVDGAAAAIVMGGAYARAQGLKPLGGIRAAASVGVEPQVMGIGPVPAIQALLEKTGLRLDQIDLVEINEAFGAQVMACARALGLDENKLNVNGGAIAIGHPLAATGIRISTTLSRALRETGKRYGIASACIGGGQGIAMLIENTEG